MSSYQLILLLIFGCFRVSVVCQMRPVPYDKYFQYPFYYVDRHTPAQRRNNMQSIRNKDTKIEISLRKELWSRGLRYRKNCKDLPGKPDMVFKRKRIAIFCDSEFWHGFDWENRKSEIKTNSDFWIKKIERNIKRDAEVNEKLLNMGYVVIRFWGKEIEKDVRLCADVCELHICSSENIQVIPRYDAVICGRTLYQNR